MHSSSTVYISKENELTGKRKKAARRLSLTGCLRLFLWTQAPLCTKLEDKLLSLFTAVLETDRRAASPPVKSLSLIHLIPLTISTSKTKPPRALLPLGASEAYRCATRAPEHTAPENGDTFLIEKNGRIEETAGVRGDSHGQAARRTSLFPHSSRTD